MELETTTADTQRSATAPEWVTQGVRLVTALMALLLPRLSDLDDRLLLLPVALYLVTWRALSWGGWSTAALQLAVLAVSMGMGLTGGW
jgi:hypothetical protein